MRPTILAAASLALVLAACSKAPEPAGPSVEHAWVRLPPVAGRPGAAYFIVRGNGAARELAGISSPQAERIELHESISSGGVMRMAPVASLPLPEAEAVTFEPGGKHAMLFGIDPAVKEGDSLSLTFHFEPAGEVTVNAAVEGVGGTSHQGH